MKTFTTEKKIFAGFLFTCICIGSFLWVTYSNMSKTSADNNAINTSLNILRPVENVFIDMQDLENGYRGFIITGNENFLEPYYQSLKGIGNNINNLLVASKADSNRYADAAALSSLVSRKIQYGKEAVSIRRNDGLNAALQFINNEKGKKFMDNIRLFVNRIEARERAAVRIENNKVLERSQKTLSLFLLLSVVVFTFLFIFFTLIRKEFLRRRTLEHQLKGFNKKLEEQVNLKTAELQEIFERVSNAFIALDKNWCYTYMNKKAADILNCEPQEMIGKNIWTVIPSSAELLYTVYQRAMDEQKYIFLEEYDAFNDRWFENHIYPSSEGLSIFFRDITDEKKKEEKIVNSEKKYHYIFENNPMPMWIYDISSLKFLDVNEAAVRHYGYTREEFLSMATADIKPEEEKERYLKLVYSKNGGLQHTGVWIHRKKNGRLINVEIISHDISFERKNARLILSNDITERIKMEEELKESQNQLRNFSSHLQNIREEERTNIAREIHDELGQQLTGLKMEASWLNKKIPNRPLINLKINGMIELIDETVKSVRRISSSLRPGILDDFGLIPALDWQSQEFEKRTGIHCEFNSTLNELSIDKSMATGIFRVFQETLTNVARHAQASEIKTTFGCDDENVLITVKDNGIGFDASAIKSKHTLGLLGMKERAKMFKGELTIKSEIGQGTIIELKVPLEKQKLLQTELNLILPDHYYLT